MSDTATIPVDQSTVPAGAPNPGATPSSDDGRYERAADNFNTDTLVDGMLSTLREDAAIPAETFQPQEQAPAGAVDRGDGRDAQGRFIAKPETPAAGDPAPAPAPGTPEATTTTAPAGTAPFQFRYNGQTQAVEGATMDAEGNVHFGKEKLGLVRQAFNAMAARGMTDEYIGQLRTHAATLEQQVKDAGERSTVAETQSRDLVGRLEQVLLEADDNVFWEKMQDLRARWPQLKADAENKFLRAQLDRATQAPGTTPAATAPAAPAAAASLPTPEDALSVSTDWIEDRKLDPAFRSVKPDEWQAYQGRLASIPFAFLRPATAKDVAEYGVEFGEIVHDTDAQAADLARFLDGQRRAATDAASAARLAADQSRRTQPSVDAPPTPGGSPAPARAPGQRPRTPEEWDAYMNDNTTL